MTPAMGKGYKIQSLDEEGINFVLLLAAGSGIAPIRAAIESEMLGLKKVRGVLLSLLSFFPFLPSCLPLISTRDGATYSRTSLLPSTRRTDQPPSLSACLPFSLPPFPLPPCRCRATPASIWESARPPTFLTRRNSTRGAKRVWK